jgi:hypothetical protein
MFINGIAALTTAGKTIAAWFMEWGWIALLVMLVSCGIAFPLYNRVENFSNRIDLAFLRKKNARQFIIQCYHEMEKSLSRKKLYRRPFCAPSEYALIIAVHLPHLALSAEVITRLFNRARYSTVPIGTEEADRAFEAYQYIVRFIDVKPGETV